MQEIIVYVIVGLALLAVFRYLRRRTGKKNKGKCGSCDGCPLKEHCS